MDPLMTPKQMRRIARPFRLTARMRSVSKPRTTPGLASPRPTASRRRCMDYEVFLVSRIHEEWERTKDHSLAVREGLASTGKVITAAGAIMIVVFGAFVPGPDRMLQQFASVSPSRS